MSIDMTGSPFAAEGPWLKAALHTHSTVSDGWLDPAGLLEAHRAQGYRVVAFTDHHRVAPLPACPPGMVAVSGVELSVPLCERQAHLVGIGLREDWPAGRRPADLAEAVAWLGRNAGFWFLAHPHWSDLTAAEVMAVPGLAAVEVFNSGCQWEIGRGYSTYPLDAALSRGRRLGALAVDDAHQPPHLGLGWTMIRSAPTAEAVLAAVAAGRYYASEGPAIEDIRLDAAAGTLSVRCPEAEQVYFICRSAKGGAWLARGGGTLAEPRWTVQPDCGYVRVEAVDARGRRAWTGPMYPAGG